MNLNYKMITNFYKQGAIALLLWAFLYSSCGEKQMEIPTEKINEVFQSSNFSQEEFTTQLKTLLPPIDTNIDSTFKQGITSLTKAFALAYQLNDYKAIWIDKDLKCERANSLLAELDSLRFEGIDREHYQYSLLKEELKKATDTKASLSDLISFDTLCTKAYLLASHDLLLGIISSKKGDTQWHHSNDSVWKAYSAVAAIGKSHQYSSLNEYKSKWGVYAILREASKHYSSLKENAKLLALKSELNISTSDSLLTALIQEEMPWLSAGENDSLTATQQLIRGYQYYFAQRLTGKLDSPTYRRMQLMPDAVLKQIAVNQERLRWMNQNSEATNIIVPLALMEMFLTRDNRTVLHMRTIVGKPSRPTPSLNAPMVNVVINPPWGVPPTILKNDVVPGLMKRGGAYLARKGLKAYDRHGNVVNSSLITGTNYKRYSYKQSPGARNALGVIKFNLPNKWDIYLHDTPHKEDFPNRNRAKSSGCIRLQNPRDLGAYILNEMEGNAQLTRNDIDTIVLTRKTQYHNLKNRIPVHIVYLTTYNDSTDSHLRILDDIYKRDVILFNKL
ncbi:MAG: L,D-transpeptidase family protein [Phycisphaerales bacterium]|nr:L,D-transpeptidase family protein [Phycisphaerales bacterium]